MPKGLWGRSPHYLGLGRSLLGEEQGFFVWFSQYPSGINLVTFRGLVRRAKGTRGEG